MTTVRALMRLIDPVPEIPLDRLSPRAERELHDLLGMEGAVVQNKRPNRRIAMALVAAMAFVVVVAGVAILKQFDQPPPMADEPFYATTAQLEGKADVIALVTVVAARKQTSNGFPELVATASVDGVAKGTAEKGTRIEFAYTEPGTGPETAEGLRTGGQFVILLITEEGSAPANLVNTTQGYYFVSNGKAVADSDNPVALSATVLHRLGLV